MKRVKREKNCKLSIAIGKNIEGELYKKRKYWAIVNGSKEMKEKIVELPLFKTMELRIFYPMNLS
ncbi:hypothetical protein ACUIAK_06360 [Bacillus cytotoxicus]